MNTILIYDGSFIGFLSAVYKVFDENIKEVSIVKPKHYVPDMFSETVNVSSSEIYSKRVWKSLEVKLTKHGANELYKAFLSEIKGTEDALLKYIVHVYATESFRYTDMPDANTLRVSQVARMVDRELGHIKNFLVFKTTRTGMEVATINSNFNMLPLIGNYFKRKYPNKKWLIYDQRRNYGLYFNTKEIDRVHLSIDDQLKVFEENNAMFYVNLQNKPFYGLAKSNNKAEINC
ncbi:TIGR03915 family putative DNA repair protein [Galbibacter pacificus]|uniref:TIGR03915 family putative DNA repair protein n=1 Tax=Galbibacter pacificus TaxID=2996052 RepID=A0ABT6FWK8_9FLAO|nr:TIGR03915 family putative DNA repair protein [Galbibacter pacificus]MDG3584101.1 TIGR03915 family putative DNA repair protein [Galbibacter pacificus]MDG3587466.1 TIGR03915 family putative DNA repair protein [Galbibacter pacificus]